MRNNRQAVKFVLTNANNLFRSRRTTIIADDSISDEFPDESEKAKKKFGRDKPRRVLVFLTERGIT